MQDPDVHIAIVSYNTCSLLDRCLASIFASPGPIALTITVADNGSTDGSACMVRQKYPGVRVVETGANIGYGRANNAALIDSPGRYYLILNSDLVLVPGAIAAMVAYLDRHPEYGAAGGNLRNPSKDGTAGDSGPQTNWAAGELTIASVLWEQTFLAKAFPRSRLFGDYFRTWWDHETECDLPQACGAFLAVRAGLFNALGGFDPIYFMYAEDTDLCKRIRGGGGTIGYAPTARAIHLHGQSSAGVMRPRMVIEHNRSRYIYFAVHQGRRAASTARAVMAAGALLRALLWCGRAAAGGEPARRTASSFFRVFAATLLLRLPGRIERRNHSTRTATSATCE